MKKTIIHIILLISILGCVNNIKKEESTFNLQNDISSFSSKLEDGDSLVILADLSACTSWWIEKNTLIKNGTKIMIKTQAKGEFIDQTELDGVQYYYNKVDSLNFENLFQFMDDKATKDRKINSNVFTVIYHQDTLKYYSDGLNDHLENIGYYLLVKRRIYPDVEIYQPVKVPPKPEDDKLDSLIKLNEEKLLNDL